MAGLNEVRLLGNLGRDPELRHTQGGTAVATLNLATTRHYRNAQDELVEETEWHRVVVWGPLAERCAEHLRKGSQVHVSGRLKTRMYEKDGVKHYPTDVVGERVQFLGKRSGDSRPHPADGPEDTGPTARTGFNSGGRGSSPPDDMAPPPGDDDISF